tara:strand:- start:16 stop:618 length:603 start_codon:yes stop_codon:yes gene_type:complete
MKIKDFQMLDLDEDTIAQILKKAGTNPKLVRNIMEGIFTPIPYSKPRFKSKVETLEKIADKKTENSKNFLYSLDEDFVFPKDELDEVIEDLQDKELFPNGYEPAEANAMKDAKGRLIYDERGTIKTKPTFLDKVVPKLKNLAVPGSPFSKAPTPQLETPNVDATRVVSNINVSPTGLTASENAYLSEEEKSMKLKSRGKV